MRVTGVNGIARSQLTLPPWHLTGGTFKRKLIFRVPSCKCHVSIDSKLWNSGVSIVSGRKGKS